MSWPHSRILAFFFVFLLLLMFSACSSLTEEMDDSGTTGDSGPDVVLCSSSYCLPDTGQTKSYTNIFGEDSDYLIHPPAYRDNGDGTVTDLNTGLMWQQVSLSSQMDWDSAGSYCSGLSLAGYSDWHLPTANELQSIVDYGESGLSIDTTAFPGTQSWYYWSSTTYVGDASDAWIVSFDYGYVLHFNKSTSYYVRCVRGSSSATSFTDNSDGTVTDQKTGLMWQQATTCCGTWMGALIHCEGLTLANQSDWRLPNIKELNSIVDRSQFGLAIDTTAFPGTQSPFYWSSTTYADGTSGAWGVFSDYGHVGGAPESSGYYVRCVRDSK